MFFRTKTCETCHEPFEIVDLPWVDSTQCYKCLRASVKKRQPPAPKLEKKPKPKPAPKGSRRDSLYLKYKDLKKFKKP